MCHSINVEFVISKNGTYCAMTLGEADMDIQHDQYITSG